MMNRSLLLSALVAVFLIAPSAFAETEPGGDDKHVISGAVLDSKNQKPLEFANIVLKSVTDSVMVSATYSGKTGEFILANLPEGTFFLKISYVGYEDKIIPGVIISKDKPQLKLGNLMMTEAAIGVGGVTVEAQRPMEEFHLDKKVINASQYPAAQGGTALDILRNQPSVQVDATDNVTLRGSSTFTVLVNGRPSVFQGADALKQIPANIVDNIELITNPSAKYDAEGAAGIININLKQASKRETRAIVNMSAGIRDKYNGDVTVNHQVGDVNLSGGLEYSNNTYWQVQDIERTADLLDGELLNFTDVDRRDTRKQYNVRLGAEYTINEYNVTSLMASFGRVDMSRRFINTVNNQTPTGTTNTYIHNDFGLEAPYVNAVFYYTHKFEPKVSEISIENTYTTVDLPYYQNTDEFLTEADFIKRLPGPLQQAQDNDNWRYENTAKVDYFYQFSNDSKLELGAQTRFSLRHYDVNYTQFDNLNEVWYNDTSRSNIFDYNNNIHAAYVTYSNSIAGFGFQAGVRAEYMDRLLEQKTLSNDYAYDKVDWFPSGSVSRKFGRNQLQLSYSRRINRPNELQLNPFPYYTDSYLTSAGNPYLLPEYIHSYELNYQHMEMRSFYSVQTYYRSSMNAVWRTQEVDETGYLTTAFGNFAETSSLGVEISSSHSIGKWLRLNPNVNLFNYHLKGNAFGDDVNTDDFTWTARLAATFTLSQATIFQLTGMYFSKQYSPQSVVDPRFYMSAVLRQTFFDKALTVTASASNLFTSAYYDVTGSGPGFSNHFIIKPEVPNVNLTLSYNINNFQRTGRIDDVDVNVGG